MKFLVVFVSALVLVAHGSDTPSDEGDSVYEIQSEAEAGDSQGVIAEEAPAVSVFGAEEDPGVGFPQERQMAYAVEDPAAERVPTPETGVYIPVIARVCTNAACVNVCRRLGYKNGICVSLDTCWCFN